MVEEQIIVGLVVEEIGEDGAWAGTASTGAQWRPVTVFATPPEVAPWTPLPGARGRRSFYAGEVAIALYSTETANYIANLETGEPRLWVVLRAATGDMPIEVVTVTADPAEGEAHTEAGADMVALIAMPAEIAAEIAAFVAANHVEHVFVKRQRDKRQPGRHERPRGPRNTDRS